MDEGGSGAPQPPDGVLPLSQQPQQLPQRRPKRSRVALACQRCKSRKQKCNGAEPSCSSCVRLSLTCHYISSAFSKPGAARVYINELEDRIAELELSLAKQGNGVVGQDHWTPMTVRDESDPLLSAVRDLSLDTGGSYVGNTSDITLARMIGSLVSIETVARKESLRDRPQVPLWEAPEYPPTSTAPSEVCYSSPTGSDATFSLMMPPDIADKVIHAYILRFAGSFPVLHTSHLKDLYQRRADLEDPYERGILHLVFALGGMFLLETTGENGDFNSEYHFDAALDKRDAILSLGDARSLTYILLLAQQCLRIPKNMGAWTLVGIAMRLCVELGLHRRKRSPIHSIRSEMEKKLFWSCYYLDRELSLSLGRPPSISDHDIDAQLPLDVDENTRDIEVFRIAAEKDQTVPANPITTLTYFIHIVRLKRIESEIQTTLYRVDYTPNPTSSYRVNATEKFLERLTAWRDAIPGQTEGSAQSLSDASSSIKLLSVPAQEKQFPVPLITLFNFQMVCYHRCVRLLLQPQLYSAFVPDRYLELCMEACRGMCQTYKRIYHHTPMAFSALSLQTVFIAGLTLVYCMWYSSNSGAAMKNFNALNDCSIMLYVMTERWTTSRKYRDAFEGIKAAVLNLIADGKHQPRRAMTDMSVDVRNTLQNLEGGLADSNREDLEQMIANMTGEQINFWGQEDGILTGQNENNKEHMGSLDLDLAFFPNGEVDIEGLMGLDTS